MNFINSVFKNQLSELSNIITTATRFATKKAGGSSKNGRDSRGKRLGLKKFGGNQLSDEVIIKVKLTSIFFVKYRTGHKVIPGNILIRQRGKTFWPGVNTGIGRDFTIYAKTEGWVKFFKDKAKKRHFIYITHINPHSANPTRVEYNKKYPFTLTARNYEPVKN